jgi:hypothetical protein
MGNGIEEIDIHGKKKRYQQVLASIKRCNKLSERNKQLLERFARDLLAEGLSHIRTIKWMQASI